jgi:hypothetical protein
LNGVPLAIRRISMTDSTPSDPSPPRERILYVAADQLRPGPHAPKNPVSTRGLTDSVKHYGILQPLLVRPGAEGYEVVAGFRRLQAAREAGLAEVPVRVYRVEDAALPGLYAASNVQIERRLQVPTTPSTDYKPTGKLGSLLEDELNRAPGGTPYKYILSLAAVILLCVWGGWALTRRLRERTPPPPATATPTPAPVPGLPPTPTPRPGRPQAGIATVAAWREVLAEIPGIEVRDAVGVPRIVFHEPVFSQLVTIDPAQEERLKRLVRRILEHQPRALLVVIGHTDNDPIRPGSEYRSNEYLSELRAKKVSDFLSQNELIPAAQLRALSSEPAGAPYPNTSAANKVRNRTVTIEIMQPRP